MAVEQLPMIRIIEFSETYEKIAQRDEFDDLILDEQGKPVYKLEAEHWVTYAPASDPMGKHTKMRVRHLRPKGKLAGPNASGEKAKFFQARWRQIEPAYEAWKSGHEVPIDGTPLSLWPGVTAAQAEALRQIGVRTVEEARDMTDLQCDKLRLPDTRGLRNSAKLFLENLEAQVTTEREAERDQEIKDLRAQLDAAMELLAEVKGEEKPKGEKEVDPEVARLRAECDKRGIKYHHFAGEKKLRELLEGEAA